jgi:hypothetical protein
MRATYLDIINSTFETVQNSVVDYVLFCLRGGAATPQDRHQKSFVAQLNVVHPAVDFFDHFQFSRLLHSLLMIPPVFISYITSFNFWKSLCLTIMSAITIYSAVPFLTKLNIPFLNPSVLVFMATVQLAYSLFLHAPFDHRNSLFLKLLTAIGISAYALFTMSSGAITVSLFGMLHFSIMPLTLALCSALYMINALCYAVHFEMRERPISEAADWNGFMIGQTSYLNALHRRRTAANSPNRDTIFDTKDPLFFPAAFLSKTLSPRVQFFHTLSLPAMVNNLLLMLLEFRRDDFGNGGPAFQDDAPSGGNHPNTHSLNLFSLFFGHWSGGNGGSSSHDDDHPYGNNRTIQNPMTLQNQIENSVAAQTPSADLSSSTVYVNTPNTDVDSHTPFPPSTPTHKNSSEDHFRGRTPGSLQDAQRSTSARSDRSDSTPNVSGGLEVFTSPITVENFDSLGKALTDHSHSPFVAQFFEQLTAHLENRANRRTNYESVVNMLDLSLPSLSSSQLSASGEDAQLGLFGKTDSDVQIIKLASEYLQSHKNTFKSDVQNAEAARYSQVHKELVTLIVTITRHCHTNDSVDLDPIVAMVMAAPEKVSARICHYNNDNFLNDSNDPAKFCFFALLAYSGYLISVHTHNDELQAHSCSKLNAICTQISTLQSALPNYRAVVRNYQPSKLIESVQQLTNLVNSSAAHQSSSIS